MANRVPDNQQGELQGLMASLSAIVAILSPLALTQLFGFFTAENAPVFFPGAPFLAASALMLLAMIPFTYGLRYKA